MAIVAQTTRADKKALSLPRKSVGKTCKTGLFILKREVLMSKALLTTTEAANFLQLSTSTLAHWRLSGRGPAFVRVGSHVRYRVEDIDAYLTSKLTTCD